MRVNVDGVCAAGVTAKDVVLAMIAKMGTGGGTGHVIEYAGSAIRAMSMEARMTVCNMSIEAGARAGMVAPDRATFEYLSRCPGMPDGAAWERQVARWSALPSDEDASFDRERSLDVRPSCLQ